MAGTGAVDIGDMQGFRVFETAEARHILRGIGIGESFDPLDHLDRPSTPYFDSGNDQYHMLNLRKICMIFKPPLSSELTDLYNGCIRSQ
jgi:hypothetical protein